MVLPASNSNSDQDMSLAECTSNPDTATAITTYSTQPECEHGDPTNGLHPHSTMRYIRTVNYYNPIKSRYDIRDYYQCTLCGYETFFVHGYIEE